MSLLFVTVKIWCIFGNLTRNLLYSIEISNLQNTEFNEVRNSLVKKITFYSKNTLQKCKVEVGDFSLKIEFCYLAKELKRRIECSIKA